MKDQCDAVEFVGGPMDGLRLISGIDSFVERDCKDSAFSVDVTDVLYVPRSEISDGVLFLDVAISRG